MTGEPDDAEGSDPSEIDFADLMTQATAATSDSSGAQTRAALMRELALVDSMRDVAEAGRYRADPRVHKIIEWIGANMCRDLSAPGATHPRWNDRRLLIFTIDSVDARDIRSRGRSLYSTGFIHSVSWWDGAMISRNSKSSVCSSKSWTMPAGMFTQDPAVTSTSPVPSKWNLAHPLST